MVGGFFHSDDMALAAATVIEGAGMQDQVKIVGIDGLKNACEAILDGQAPGLGYQPERPYPRRLDLGRLSDRFRHRQRRGWRAEVHPRRRRPDRASNAEGYIWLHDNYQY